MSMPAPAFEPQHVRTPQECPVCWRLAGGAKLYPGEQPELAPVIQALHWDAMDAEGEDGWPPSRQLPPPWRRLRPQGHGDRDQEHDQRDEPQAE